MPSVSGILRKMDTHYTAETHLVNYTLNLDGEGVLPLNGLVGAEIRLDFWGNIYCVACGRKIAKTFNRGYCYPCFMSLPECDSCMVQPEKCHFHLGTCRDSAWGEQHCFQKHTLYLARSSSVKIGITRSIQQIHRWMDQGAVEALVIGFFENRFQVGQAEAAIAKIMKDRTNWRQMLKNQVSEEPFAHYYQAICDTLSGEQNKALIPDGSTYSFSYPVQSYPEKVNSKTLEKLPFRTSRLRGIKGQYFILEDHVLNLRSHGGYQITFSY